MKTQLIIYPALMASLFFACGEKSEDTYEDSIEAQNEMSGEMHEGDTNYVKRDGTLLQGSIDQMDSVNLPAPIINAIEAESSLSKDKITGTRRYTENSLNYYEVTFATDAQESKTVVFDENGMIKSKD
ncbi:hypothetical protein GCM10009119_12120 [Algoriphagus jejuensis]|uniref:PepSY-like beta-lactamase-inhibitor n=1 Tax=Algoriphagus jejuensis TaxID=419934 RepID=A0ABN1MYA3_9BACT